MRFTNGVASSHHLPNPLAYTRPHGRSEACPRLNTRRVSIQLYGLAVWWCAARWLYTGIDFDCYMQLSSPHLAHKIRMLEFDLEGLEFSKPRHINTVACKRCRHPRSCTFWVAYPSYLPTRAILLPRALNIAVNDPATQRAVVNPLYA